MEKGRGNYKENIQVAQSNDVWQQKIFVAPLAIGKEKWHQKHANDHNQEKTKCMEKISSPVKPLPLNFIISAEKPNTGRNDQEIIFIPDNSELTRCRINRCLENEWMHSQLMEKSTNEERNINQEDKILPRLEQFEQGFKKERDGYIEIENKYEKLKVRQQEKLLSQKENIELQSQAGIMMTRIGEAQENLILTNGSNSSLPTSDSSCGFKKQHSDQIGNLETNNFKNHVKTRCFDDTYNLEENEPNFLLSRSQKLGDDNQELQDPCGEVLVSKCLNVYKRKYEDLNQKVFNLLDSCQVKDLSEIPNLINQLNDKVEAARTRPRDIQEGPASHMETSKLLLKELTIARDKWQHQESIKGLESRLIEMEEELNGCRKLLEGSERRAEAAEYEMGRLSTLLFESCTRNDEYEHTIMKLQISCNVIHVDEIPDKFHSLADEAAMVEDVYASLEQNEAAFGELYIKLQGAQDSLFERDEEVKHLTETLNQTQEKLIQRNDHLECEKGKVQSLIEELRTVKVELDGQRAKTSALEAVVHDFMETLNESKSENDISTDPASYDMTTEQLLEESNRSLRRVGDLSIQLAESQAQIIELTTELKRVNNAGSERSSSRNRARSISPGPNRFSACSPYFNMINVGRLPDISQLSQLRPTPSFDNILALTSLLPRDEALE